MSRMLLHKYPRVRNLAADTLGFCTAVESVLSSNWNDPVTDLKPAVVALRNELGVAGLQNSQASSPRAYTAGV